MQFLVAPLIFSPLIYMFLDKNQNRIGGKRLLDTLPLLPGSESGEGTESIRIGYLGGV